jgi:hypothetical protein
MSDIMPPYVYQSELALGRLLTLLVVLNVTNYQSWPMYHYGTLSIKIIGNKNSGQV